MILQENDWQTQIFQGRKRKLWIYSSLYGHIQPSAEIHPSQIRIISDPLFHGGDGVCFVREKMFS